MNNQTQPVGSPSELSGKELELLRSIGRDGAVSQRSLSERLGLSLGITNLLLRRLIQKGYVKVTALNRRSMRYILTPKGFAEKVRKSYAFALRTLRAHEAIRRRLDEALRRQIARGQRRFVVVGDGELAKLLELVLLDLRSEGVEWSRGPADGSEPGLRLLTEPGAAAKDGALDLAAEIAETEAG